MRWVYNIKKFSIQKITVKKKILKRKKIKQDINKIFKSDNPENPDSDNLQSINPVKNKWATLIQQTHPA